MRSVLGQETLAKHPIAEMVSQWHIMPTITAGMLSSKVHLEKKYFTSLLLLKKEGILVTASQIQRKETMVLKDKNHPFTKYGIFYQTSQIFLNSQIHDDQQIT